MFQMNEKSLYFVISKCRVTFFIAHVCECVSKWTKYDRFFGPGNDTLIFLAIAISSFGVNLSLKRVPFPKVSHVMYMSTVLRPLPMEFSAMSSKMMRSNHTSNARKAKRRCRKIRSLISQLRG